MMVIPSLIGALVTVTIGLKNGLKELEILRRAETILTMVLFRSVKIPEVTRCLSYSCERPSANSSEIIIIIIIIIVIIIEDFAIPGDHSVKLKENEMKNKHQDICTPLFRK